MMLRERLGHGIADARLRRRQVALPSSHRRPYPVDGKSPRR
jgi:hypothetical protein